MKTSIRDCDDRWSACPVAKRAWLKNNPKIVRFLKREALRERGFFPIWKRGVDIRNYDKEVSSYNNRRLIPVAKKARDAGLYAPSSGLQEIGRLLQGYVERAYGIKRLWLKDGWKQVQTKKKFDIRGCQMVYRPMGSANRFSDVRKY